MFDPTATTGLARASWTPLAACGDWQAARRTADRLAKAAQFSARTLQDADFWAHAAYTRTELAADLETAASRGCQVDIVFETEETAPAPTPAHAQPLGAASGARRWRWPAASRAAGGVLHAKLLVVDGRRALVSANLTQRALTTNLEAGVLIEDAGLTAELQAHVP